MKSFFLLVSFFCLLVGLPARSAMPGDFERDLEEDIIFLGAIRDIMKEKWPDWEKSHRYQWMDPRKLLVYYHETHHLLVIRLGLSAGRDYCSAFENQEETLREIELVVQAALSIAETDIPATDRAEGLSSLYMDEVDLVRFCWRSDGKKMFSSRLKELKPKMERVSETLVVTRMGGKSKVRSHLGN